MDTCTDERRAAVDEALTSDFGRFDISVVAASRPVERTLGGTLSPTIEAAAYGGVS